MLSPQQIMDLSEKDREDDAASMLMNFITPDEVLMSTTRESRPNLLPTSIEEFRRHQDQGKFAGNVVARLKWVEGLPSLIAEIGLLYKSAKPGSGLTYRRLYKVAFSR